jgi:hypothetical protein
LLKNVNARLFGALFNEIQSLIENASRQRFFAISHQLIDEAGNQSTIVFNIRLNIPFGCPISSCHIPSPISQDLNQSKINIVKGKLTTIALQLFGPLGSILGAASTLGVNAGGVQRSAHNMVANAGQVFDPTTTNKHYRVLLQAVPLARDVRSDFNTIS